MKMEKKMGRKLIGTARYLVLTAIIGLMFLTPGSVTATPQPATRFWGPASRNGHNVSLSDTVTAWIEGSSLKTVTPIKWVDGITYYALDILIDDPNTPEKDGAVIGDIVRFKVTTAQGDIPGPSAIWPGAYMDVKFPLYLTVIPGDANGDGVIDMGDVTAVQLMIFGFIPQTVGADANQDGVVDMGDVTAIMLMILGIYAP
jgi:hypothetical protein